MSIIKKPFLYMIGGPNGAGKTTAAMNIMPAVIDCFEYVNADAIAGGLSPFRPAEVSINAGRLMLKRIRELADKREDFAFETTMASRSFALFLKSCKKSGYMIHLIYIWLQSPELAIARVAERVKSGGHFVPDETVRNRYHRGLYNFFHIYMQIADNWAFYDNSRAEILLIAEKSKNEEMRIITPDIWKSILEVSNVSKK
jgi:predicted ABC-type ATPase